MHPLHDRVLQFIASPEEAEFEPLALEVFRHQFETVEPYRMFCQRHGRGPETVRRWIDIPAVPARAFALVELRCGPAAGRFRSSGTTRGTAPRSVHAMPDLRLYRAAAVEGMRRFLFPGEPSMRLLSLIHPADRLPESSLAQMIDWAMAEFAAPGSGYAVRDGELDVAGAAESLRAGERDGAPLCLLATTAALIVFLEHCRQSGLEFRLPHGSRVMDTGGAKGAPRPISRNGLRQAIWNTLAVPGYFCVNEYGMCELSSQLYENVIADRAAGRFGRRALACPPWMRSRALDPAGLGDVPAGERGLLCHYDLANAGTAVAVLTEDVGRIAGGGIELLGRAAGAEARGCSLVWAEGD